ncbi:MAG: hypothetical protein V1874_03130 [Spirochaetota bacterium]
MEIQNISGADIISGGFNANSRVSGENAKVEKQEAKEETVNPEKEKGNIIDTKA